MDKSVGRQELIMQQQEKHSQAMVLDSSTFISDVFWFYSCTNEDWELWI